MKKIFIFLLLLSVGWLQHGFSQKAKCGSQILHEKKMRTDPAYKARYLNLEKAISQTMREGKTSAKSRANCASPTFFPIAVHFDWVPSAADQAKLIILAQNQIATLNSAFNNTDCQGTTNSNCFEFFLATHNHPASSGLADGQPAVTFGGSPGADYCATSGGETTPCNLTNWVGYMNITVNALSGGKECTDLGVSHLPGNPITMNSMSVNSCAFGSIGVITGVAQALDNANANQCDCLESSTNGGTTVVHEIGHFLGLMHTFCEDNADNGASGATPMGSIPGDCVTTACDCDLVGDTPPQAYSNNGCPGGSTAGTVPNPSNGGIPDAFSNFMDYVDDACMNCFSQGQYTRVAATIASPSAGISNYRTRAQVTSASPVLATTIPTMSEWGLMIFGLVILNLGVVFVQRRELIRM